MTKLMLLAAPMQARVRRLPRAFMRSCLTILALALLVKTAGAAELLMVDRPNCPYCKAWEIQIGSVYDRTEEGRFAPLQRVDISDIEATPYEFAEPVLYAPTFIVLDGYREVGRIVGYADEAMFWGMLQGLLRKASR